MLDIMYIKINCLKEGQNIKYSRSIATEQYTTEELLDIISKINKILEEEETDNGRN